MPAAALPAFTELTVPVVSSKPPGCDWRTVNAELVLLYCHIGHRIRRDILAEARAQCGEKIVSTLSRQLIADYGAGFSLGSAARTCST